MEKDKFAKYIFNMIQTMINDIMKKISEEKPQ